MAEEEDASEPEESSGEHDDRDEDSDADYDDEDWWLIDSKSLTHWGFRLVVL